MRQKLIFSGCCIIAVGFSGLTLHAATPGSNRPGIQDNFHQLIQNNSCPGCDLAGVVLTRVNLSGANLEGANLAGAKLYLADLSDANLKGANLQGAGLGGTDFGGADLTGANLTGAILEGAYFKGAKTDGIITDQPQTGSGAVTGETVFIADESQSKHAPYSQEVVVEKRRDLNETPAAVEEQEPKQEPKEKAAEQVGPPAGQEQVAPLLARSKQPIPMADAVVPEPVQDQQPVEESPVDDTVILKEQSKQKVVSSPEEVKTVPGAETIDQYVEIDTVAKKGAGDSDGKQQIVSEKIVVQEKSEAVETVTEDSPVHDMIVQIEADNTKIQQPSAEQEPVSLSQKTENVSAPAETASEPISTVPSVQESEQVEPVDEGSPVHDMIARIEADTAAVQQPAAGQGQQVGEQKMEDPSESSEPIAVPVAVSSSMDDKRNEDGQLETESVESQSPEHQIRQEPELKVAGEPVQQQKEENAASSRNVAAMVADIEEAADKEPSAGSLVYTVETPEMAAAKQEALIERLLDDDRCVECDLPGVDLSGKRLKEVDLERANLQGANLEGANLSGANLKGANLSGANLKNADLSDADLYRANFSGADLTGADLTEALVDSADFTGAVGVSLAGAVPAD